MSETGRLPVLFGSQTFTAQETAERIWRTTKSWGFRGPVQPMDDYPISRLIHEEFAIFVCATTGQGDEPDNMRKFWKFLLRKNLPSNSLVKLRYGVLGLGDSSYTKFNFVGKRLHKRLMQLGATPLVDVGLCDYQHDLGHDAVIIPWVKEYCTKLKTFYPNIQMEDLKTKFTPRWKVSLLKEEGDIYDNGNVGFDEDIYFCHGQKDKYDDALLLEIENTVRTTDESHFQEVRLITLKTTDQSQLCYKPGDVFNIRPRNSREDIDDLFDMFRTHGIDIKPQYRLLVEECHEDMAVPEFLIHPLTLYQIAEQYWDLKAYPTQYIFSLLALVSDDKLERDKCTELSAPEGQEDWLNYARRPRRTVLEVLHDFHKTASKLTIEILFELFSSIKPRSFSIASSSVASKGQSLDILLAVVKYYSKLKKPRLGLASNWLGGLTVGDRVYGWIKKGTFVFPDDVGIPHILISPGTGLAPMRSLLQERECQGTASKYNMHLFFGCRYREKDFHCRDDLERMQAEGKLTLYCAFSRDQEDKIYVQHKITEHGPTLWRLINEQQAYIFISGTSRNMPDNVRDALSQVLRGGGLGAEEAGDMLRSMEDMGRLQVEAW